MSRQDTLEPVPGPAEPSVPAPSARRTTPTRSVVLLGLAAGVVLVLVVAAAVSWVSRATGVTGAGAGDGSGPAPASWARDAVGAADLAERSGVRITRVAVTGEGGLVDLRFEVLDADKAASLHDPATPPAVIDEASGLVLRNLLMEHSHSRPFQPGVTYYLIFENPGNWVHAGSSVTVLLGDAQVEHLVVQ
jgi:hypothetical protein